MKTEHQEVLEGLIIHSPEDSPRVMDMLQAAGLTGGEVIAGENTPHFLESLLAIAAINRGKSVGYGSYTSNYAGEAPVLRAAHAYSDLKRKWVRFENLIKMYLETKDIGYIHQLQDQLSDMAVYPLMMMEIFEGMIKEHEAGAEKDF